MKTYVWSIPTRLFHWLLFIGLVGAFILGQTEGDINFHSAFGYLAGSLVFLRIIWGFVGPKYSKFSDFPVGFKSLTEFFTNMKASKAKHIGHNPFASLVMLGIMLTVLALACSGTLTLASEGVGPLAFLNIGENEIFEELHEIFVKVLIGFVILHLLGLIVDKLLHGDNGTLFSMFTGYKTKEGESVQLTGFQKLYSAFLIIIPVALFAYGATMQNLPLDDEDDEAAKLPGKIQVDDDDD